MNTSTSINQHLTAADLETLDIEELLRQIFASDVDLKDLLNRGIEQVKQTEAMARKAAKAEKKAAKKEARQEKLVENGAVIACGSQVGINGALIVAAGACAVTLTNPVGWGLLAGTATVRTAKYTRDLLQARRERDAVRRGDVIEVTEEEAVRKVLGDSRFEAILGVCDAGVMAQLALVGKDPVWMVLGAMHLILAGWNGARWAGAAQALTLDEDLQTPEPAKQAKVAAKAGAHRATSRVRVATV